jgi:uncharacterized protein YjaZ
MKVVFTESAERAKVGQNFLADYKKVVSQAFTEVQKIFPIIVDEVTFVVQAAPWECIPETGEGGFTRNSQLVILSFDPAFPYGEAQLLKTLRHTVYHELSHVARYSIPLWHKNILEAALMEGLATVFERDKAGATPLWGKYRKTDVKKWYKELKEYKNTQAFGDYLYKHPDGRRWIAYKTGTWIIDQTMGVSGKSIEELTLLSCPEILKLGGYDA